MCSALHQRLSVQVIQYLPDHDSWEQVRTWGSNSWGLSHPNDRKFNEVAPYVADPPPTNLTNLLIHTCYSDHMDDIIFCSMDNIMSIMIRQSPFIVDAQVYNNVTFEQIMQIYNGYRLGMYFNRSLTAELLLENGLLLRALDKFEIIKTNH